MARTGSLWGWIITPARSAGMLEDVATENPGLVAGSATRHDLITCNCWWLPNHARKGDAVLLAPIRFSWPTLQALTEEWTRKGQQRIPDTLPASVPTMQAPPHSIPQNMQQNMQNAALIQKNKTNAQLQAMVQVRGSPPINPHGLSSPCISVPASSEPWATHPRRAPNSRKSSRSSPNSRQIWG